MNIKNLELFVKLHAHSSVLRFHDSYRERKNKSKKKKVLWGSRNGFLLQIKIQIKLMTSKQLLIAHLQKQ